MVATIDDSRKHVTTANEQLRIPSAKKVCDMRNDGTMERSYEAKHRFLKFSLDRLKEHARASPVTKPWVLW